VMMPGAGQGPAFAFSSIKVLLGGEAGEWDYVTLELREGARAACCVLRVHAHERARPPSGCVPSVGRL